MQDDTIEGLLMQAEREMDAKDEAIRRLHERGDRIIDLNEAEKLKHAILRGEA